MMTRGYGFIPRPGCTVGSGACFQESQCLGSCKKPKPLSDLEQRIEKLEAIIKEMVNNNEGKK